MQPNQIQYQAELDRRRFLQAGGAAAALTTLASGAMDTALRAATTESNVIRFDGPDSLYHGPGWETLNPGYWQVKEGALRRRLSNYGDRARPTGFPFHYETHRRNGGLMNVEYDPSLPEGIIYRRDWKLSGPYAVTATLTYRGHQPNQREGDRQDWQMYQEGYGLMGLVLGAKSLFESFGKNRNTTMATWTDDGKFQIISSNAKSSKQRAANSRSKQATRLQAGDRIQISLDVQPVSEREAQVTATLSTPDGAEAVVSSQLSRRATEGYVGIAARGLVDFEVNELSIEPGENTRLHVGHAACYTCYPLGDTLRQVDGQWRVRFIGLFASEGQEAAVRVSDTEHPRGG